jgi:hypothetical protein
MIAYDKTKLLNLQLIKEVKQWKKDDFIQPEQYVAITQAYPATFYHPNLIIRILLFIASLIALGGITGLLGLMFADAMGERILTLAFFYGLASFVALEFIFIKGNNHYKSGVNEALLYHSIGWTVGGFIYIVEGNEYAILFFSLLVLTFSAIRYADLISTTCAIAVLAYLIFKSFYDMGGVVQFIIPFVFIIVFTPLYFLLHHLRKSKELQIWTNVILLSESLSLLLIYAAGNYFVVRNASESLMNLYLEEGQDIPYAFVFYFLTALIPILYLYFGIRNKDIVLIRVSLIALAFSAFTFKYYFSLGHPEITLTLAGAVLITVALALFRYLRTMRNGYTRENIIKEKWASANPEAFIMSQTLGGNKMTVEEVGDMGGGGVSTGGGSSDSF